MCHSTINECVIFSSVVPADSGQGKNVPIRVNSPLLYILFIPCWFFFAQMIRLEKCIYTTCHSHSGTLSCLYNYSHLQLLTWSIRTHNAGERITGCLQRSRRIIFSFPLWSKLAKTLSVRVRVCVHVRVIKWSFKLKWFECSRWRFVKKRGQITR